ncbi:glycoside hydrolase family 97 protein [Mucilaginibacter auburnensis]|uniref:Glycosyl hydrolase family 97 n=1 Tax=Mucilaginibacter auburnensis TaxID=1457233 RepID=A0A2H9VQL1_9SPHI|nr:glycoside hydrolase family 97 protein [Mucilaginibacter auburnensis]PJJ83094.1 glycosyl hydrolase family 97 [Mucilaginibacter auburnensis]
MKRITSGIVGLVCTALLCVTSAYAQKLTVESPNKKISVGLFNQQNANSGEWYLKVSYVENGKATEAIQQINLGLVRADQEFAKELAFVKAGKPVVINEQYKAVHGKRALRSNSANELAVSFQNPDKTKLNVIIRAYNDGMAFRYEFPDKREAIAVKDELTSYTIPKETNRWMEKWNAANEGLYLTMADDKVQQQEWCYPALFNTKDKAAWFLLHEADLDRNYCGTKLSNTVDITKYKLTFPNPKDGRGTGVVEPTISFPWRSPWRVVIMGTLQDVVTSTLVDDVSRPSILKNTDWIKPGVASWNYWSSNHGTKDYKIVTKFADLAADMNWPYTLLDWEWDSMGNGGKLEDALTYIKAKGIKPLMWYNSGGNHTTVTSTPKDRMLTHESRVEEFTKLNKLGVVGVKIDFFESEKQNMIQYYLDILDDAAKFNIMVYFHGCLVPRGWERTYPHLMTYEAVRGAEWYNNTPEFTMPAPEHNTILPFTRNVVGGMDYTPVTFTNSQFPHVTSYGHELALSVIFESGLQHMADRPEGYYALPDAPKAFLRDVPNAWDDTKLLDGTPGKDVTLARRKGNSWYIGGINAEQREKRKNIKLDFLANGTKYKMTLIADGAHDKDFATSYLSVDKTSAFDVRMLRRGGFAAVITPIE